VPDDEHHLRAPAGRATPDPRSEAYERLVRLQEVGVRLTAARTTHDVTEVVLDEMAESVGAVAAALSLLEPDGTTVRVVGARGFAPEMVTRWATFDVTDRAPMAVAIHTGQSVMLRSAEEIVDQFPGLTEEIELSGRRALVGLPLATRGRAMGAIGLGFDVERLFDDDECSFLEALSLQCAVALDRSQAYEAEATARAQAEAASARLAFLAAASTTLAASLDWERTLAQVAELAVPRLADVCAISLVADDRIAVVKVAHVDPQQAATVLRLYQQHQPGVADLTGVGAVVRTGKEVLLPVVDDAMLRTIAVDDGHLAQLQALGLTSLVVVPLCAAGRPLGAVSLGTTGDRHLELDDLVLVRELCARASQAIANAQLYRERAHVARTLQATLLPPIAPKIPGLEVATRFVAGGDGVDVGGDFYDVFPAGEPGSGSWHVVIGDVRGKGIEAAALTGVARSTIRSAAIVVSTPAEMLRHLNEVLVRADAGDGAGDGPDEGDPRFCTMVVGTLTPMPTGVSAELAVAGHPLPFLLRADGSTEQVGVPGTLLGIVAAPGIADTTVVLGPGDALVLFTDGITERHAGDRFFEEEGLAKVLGRCAGFTADTLAERIETAARAFVEDAPRDDVAILVVRVPERAASTTSASTDLPAQPLSARRARRFVVTALEAFDVRGLDEVAELLTSEVVTNAVVHAHSGVRVTVESVPGGARVSVADSNPLVPALRPPVHEAEHGRGLHLVDTLAHRWGVDAVGEGKAIWFELRTEGRTHG